MKGKIENISIALDGSTLRFTAVIPRGRGLIPALQEIGSDDAEISVKRYREKRSLDANAYMWVLLARLSEKLSEDKPITREQLYKDYIRQSNNFTYMLVKYEKAEEIANWLEKTDTFRVVEIIGRVKVGDQISAQLRCFWGSSTYDTKQMSQLIDKIVEDCKEQGIETRPQEEIERMLKIWEESQSCRSKMSASGAELQRT